MEIAPCVHAVRLLSCYGFLIVEERLTLVDAGLPGSGRRLRRYVERIGRSLDELDTIICTHAHPDHIGGVREIASASNAEVLMHPADLAGLQITLREAVAARSHVQLIAALTRGPEDARPIEDGQVIPVLGGLSVVHTPGHTPGSVCLYAPAHKLLFTGDVLQVIRGRLTFASVIFSHDNTEARASIARLAALDVDTIALSHYPPWRRRSNATLRALATKGAPA